MGTRLLLILQPCWISNSTKIRSATGQGRPLHHRLRSGCDQLAWLPEFLAAMVSLLILVALSLPVASLTCSEYEGSGLALRYPANEAGVTTTCPQEAPVSCGGGIMNRCCPSNTKCVVTDNAYCCPIGRSNAVLVNNP